jgi:hypothetical protein
MSNATVPTTNDHAAPAIGWPRRAAIAALIGDCMAMRHPAPIAKIVNSAVSGVMRGVIPSPKGTSAYEYWQESSACGSLGAQEKRRQRRRSLSASHH